MSDTAADEDSVAGEAGPAAERRSAETLAVTNCILNSSDEGGTIFIWKRPNGGHVLLIFGPRKVLASSVIRVLVDDEPNFHVIRPGMGLPRGKPEDWAFAATDVIAGRNTLTLEVRTGEKFLPLATYQIGKHDVITRKASGWSAAVGYPLVTAPSDRETRHGDMAALLDNFRAQRTRWPELRPSRVPAKRNLETPIPDLEHRTRIMARTAASDPDGSVFLDFGWRQLNVVLRIAEAYAVPLTPETTTLDWGVGCGRLARHMPRQLRTGFVGIDVDPVNVEWCTANMPFGRYEAVDARSRTGFADSSFDLIYGYSVMSHLSEQDQFHWLAELARISCGTMILSVRSLYGMASSPWAERGDEFWDYVREGFVSTKTLPDIEDVTPKGYYRDAAHTPAYIRSRWKKYVNIVDIIPGAFGTREDAVVCTPLGKA